MMKLKSFFILLTGCLLLSSCISLQPLEVRSIENVQMPGISFAPEIRADLVLYNPNSYSACLSKIELQLLGDGTAMGTVGIVENVRLKRKSEVSIPLSFSTTVMELAFVLPEKVKMMQSQHGMEMKLLGRLQLRKFLFKKNFDISIIENIRL